jgi:hypothetical protein
MVLPTEKVQGAGTEKILKIHSTMYLEPCAFPLGQLKARSFYSLLGARVSS